MPIRVSKHHAKAYGLKPTSPRPTRPNARQRFHGYLSGYEVQYADILEGRRQRQEIRRWLYEGITLRLAARVAYTPDFLIENRDGSLEFHEVKGFKRPVGMVKLKVAARQFAMFRFVLVTQMYGIWQYEQVTP